MYGVLLNIHRVESQQMEMRKGGGEREERWRSKNKKHRTETDCEIAGWNWHDGNRKPTY